MWEVATLNLKLGDAPSPPAHTSKMLYYKPKPEITVSHQFNFACSSGVGVFCQYFNEKVIAGETDEGFGKF